MLGLLLALCPLSMAQDWTPPGWYEPVLYPNEVLPEEEVVGGELRVEGGGALVLEYTEVVAEVNAGLARVTMTQFFANPYDEPIEAKYLLPLPTGAAVDRMDIAVGDRLIEGFVLERSEARALYDEAKEDGRKAALLEQQRENLFTQYIAGICPDERVAVTIEYIEQVAYEDGLYELVIPTTVGERYSPPWVQDRAALVTPYSDTGRKIDITVVIDEGMPVEALFSDSHAIEVRDEGDWGAEVGLMEAEVPNKDFSLTWSLAGEENRASVVAHRQADDDGYLALNFEPQLLDDHFVARPRELIFVIDTSCSMQGEPFDMARQSVLLALQEMGPADTFNLVRFSDAASALFDSPQRNTAANRAVAKEWLKVFDSGGTNMEQGIIKALTMPGDPQSMRLVLMVTDGFVGGEDEMFATVRKYLGSSRLFSLGVGSSVNRYLLEGLAAMGRGDVSYQLRGSSAKQTVRSFYDRIAHPAMTDIRIDWGDLEVFEQYPRRIPDLWAGQPLRVVARYRGEGAVTVKVRAKVGREDIELELPVDLPAVAPEHASVSTLWARRKIRDLEWYPGTLTPSQVKNKVIDVALEHNLVSKYTSLVAVDDQPCPCGQAKRLVQVANESPDGAPGAGGGLGSHGYGMGGGGSGMGTGSGSWSSSQYGASNLSVNGLIGTKGTQVGSGGLGTRGSGLGGGGSADLSISGALARGAYTGQASADSSGFGELRPRLRAGDAVETGEVSVMGSMDRTLISDIVRRNIAGIRYCYQRELTKDPSLAGRVTMKFTIAADGTVSAAEVSSSTLANAATEQCLVHRFYAMTFPVQSGGGEMIVNYPLIFSPE